MKMTIKEILTEFERHSKPQNIEGMGKYGITASKIYGIPMTELRRFARLIGKDHQLALKIYETGSHEARILASLIDEKRRVTKKQMDEWARQFENWADCDSVCLNLFDQTDHAYDKALKWSRRRTELVKRAAFSIMAGLAVHDKLADNEDLAQFFPIIEREAADERKLVRKAVNWALRQIGKRNAELNIGAIETAHRIVAVDAKSARWIATDALRELESRKIRNRLESHRK